MPVNAVSTAPGALASVDIQRYDRGRLIGLTWVGLGAGPKPAKQGLSNAQQGSRYQLI
jgi:hypothetical protein